jgi:hypothetical protein
MRLAGWACGWVEGRNEIGSIRVGRAALGADIEREIQQVLHSTFGYVQDDDLYVKN